MSNSYKHIIHTVPAISEEASGPSYSVVRLCDSLVSKNNTITLAVLESGVVSPLIQYLKQFPISFWPARLGISRPFKKWIIEQSRDAKVDIIHNHGLWMMPNIYPSYAAKNYGVPLMLAPRGALSVHAMASGSKVKKLFWPLLQRPALDAVTCFHATSFSEYEDIRRLGFNQPVAVLPNGIDIPEIQACENKQYRTLLFLGRIHPIKGLDLLLRAWKNVHLRFSEWELRVIGPDNRGHLREMRSLASDLGLKRIRFSGPVYGSKKSKVF